jgi:nicotinate-nucleotide adenylyltransferase
VRGGPERVGVFGGTFDPIHVGHIAAAVDVRARLGLDRMLVIPNGNPWQKREDVVATAADRLAMVEAAIEGIDGVHVSSLEVDRDVPSVTADTLEALAAPSRRLYLVLGADAVANMPSWRRIEETRDLAVLVIVERAGEHAEAPGPGWQVERVPIPRLDVSSTDIRQRLADGRPIDGIVPPAVIAVMRARGLYTRSW